MKKSSRGRREQPHLNLDLPVETEETYSLEDILNEFGGWSKQPEAEPADVSEPDVQPSETLYVREEAPAEQEEPVREADTEPELPVQPSDVADPAENTAASAPQPPETEAADREAGERQPPRFQFVRMEDLPKKPAPAAEAVLPQAQPVRKRERQPAAPKTPRRPRREAARHAPAEPAKKTRPAASARLCLLHRRRKSCIRLHAGRQRACCCAGG